MTTPEFQPWEGFFVQCDPKTGRILAVTVAAQTVEAHEAVQTMVNVILSALNGARVCGN